MQKLTIFLLSICLISSVNVVQATSNSKIDFQEQAKKAEEYFTNELNFTISPGSVKKAVLNNRKDIVIVDVRAKKAYLEGHIPGAINIPFHEYNNFQGDEKEFKGLIKNGYNYIYCYELLCSLAQKAAKKFASLGYPVKEMKGGYKSWKEHNYPISMN
ncbi:MAG: rhodanese-like domain-containing protein [Legionellales bacterium]|nr:rhodanese-like domain-containing protein [Legionellales bacterium]